MLLFLLSIVNRWFALDFFYFFVITKSLTRFLSRGFAPGRGFLRRYIMRRYRVNKSKSARHFRHQVATVKSANLRSPMRGGFRF